MPGWQGEGLSQAINNFSNRNSSSEGLKGTLSFAYEFILLPVHSIQEATIPTSGFALEAVSAPYLTAQVWLGCTASSSCYQAFWPNKSGSPSAQLAVTQSLAWAWAVGKPGRRAGLTPHVSTLARQIHIVPSSLVRMRPSLGSAHEQNCYLRSLLGHYRYELVLPGSVCWLSQAPPLFSVTVTFSVVEPRHRFPCGLRGVKSEYRIPQYWGSGCQSWVFFFHWRPWEFRGERSTWCCSVRGEVQCSQCAAILLALE